MLRQHENLKVLRYPDLLKLGLVTNRMTLWRWVKAGGFPAPLRLGPNSICWKASEVEAFLEAKAAERETVTG